MQNHLFNRWSNNWRAYWTQPGRIGAPCHNFHCVQAQFLWLEKCLLELQRQLQEHLRGSQFFGGFCLLCWRSYLLSGGGGVRCSQRFLLGLYRGRKLDWGSQLDLGPDFSLARKVKQQIMYFHKNLYITKSPMLQSNLKIGVSHWCTKSRSGSTWGRRAWFSIWTPTSPTSSSSTRRTSSWSPTTPSRCQAQTLPSLLRKFATITWLSHYK